MTIQYVNTNAGDFVRLHDVLRVTFAEELHWFVPDDVASQNLRAEVDNLIADMEQGGYGLAPVSDVNVPPGALAWTIDFMPPSGSVSVGSAISQLDAGLRTLLTSNGYIGRVEKITGALAGAPDAGTERGDTSTTLEEQLQETAFGRQLAGIFGKAVLGLAVLGGITLAIVYAPEIKLALKARR